MRRTTIYRSELMTAAALCALAAAPLAAQIRAPNVTQPRTAAQNAANATNQNIEAQQNTGADPSAAPGRRVVLGGESQGAMQQSQTPSTHTVAQGETLWSLAQQYLGDPMLWPELYRLNTDVVEDPHWIYPGEELRLTAPPQVVAADTTVVVNQQNLTVTPTADTARPAAVAAPLTGPTIFSQRANVRARSGTNLEIASNRAYRAVREGEYFSSGFLTEGQELSAGRIARTSAEERDAGRTRTAARLYETILVSPPPGDELQAGDLLLTYRRVEDDGAFGDVIIPTGLATVLGRSSTDNALFQARVRSLFESMQTGQELLKVQPFVYNSNVRAEPVTGGVEGRVIRLRQPRGVPQIQDVLFFDKGANDGVRLGDIIQIFITRDDAEHGGFIEQDQARAIVVNTRPRTATAVIVQLYRADVGSQSQIRQVRRMPS